MSDEVVVTQEQEIRSHGKHSIIRKYRNRKLYDCQAHSYVTLETILDYVRANVEFKVLDPEERDITEDIIIQSVVTTKIQDPKLRQSLISFAKNA